MSGFEARAAVALADPLKRANVPRFAERAADNRVRGLEGLDVEALRDAGERARSRAIADLPALLDQLQANLERNGATVYRAATGADAARYVTELALRHGRMVVKGKSMAAEEIGLNERLEAAGIEVVETDLGEFIVQAAGEAPEHIIIPAIHKTKDQVRVLFEPLAGRPIGDDPADLNAFARAHLRERFLTAPVGITGVNFAVAETGTIVLVTNEGNGRMCSSLPRVHVAIMGMERVVAQLSDLAVLLPLLTRSATGQKISSYVSMLNGPRRDGEGDGPDEMYVVILDNGRSRIRETPYRSVLNCIRCGACQNVCPVYRQVGGTAYGWVYGGPIGAVLTPLLHGDQELGHASSLCAACDDVCPVRIPLHELLLGLRRDRAADSAGALERLAFRLWGLAWSRPWLYRLTTRLGRRARGPVPMLRRWTRTRDLPVHR
ncbi:MAG TPA: LutB/LldF family L-lactate oxidation iron-sulfur protein [Gaiellales bacterium]|jgi:L-lactate dehydrogenase complex protein LldF|nr:LutB/LldF family L-lactate oxidation iron-sulfur protein [Gaiellales bacterium]